MTKKWTVNDFTSRTAILAETFSILYFFLVATAFGVNGTEVPSVSELTCIFFSGVFAVGCWSKWSDEYEATHT